MMRIENVIKNVRIAMVFQVSMLLLAFVDRKIFLDVLGVEYLGVNGLFTNIISMLALAELGVGSAIIYNLYEPLSKGDEKTVVVLMRIYKRFYFVIGCIIGIIGVAAIGLLPIFIQDVAIPTEEINMTYYLFVLGTVATYWTGYKRSLLYADQKNYKILIADMSANAISLIIKMVCLVMMPSYTIYVLIHIVTKLIPNLWATKCVNEEYTYLKTYKSVPKDKEVTKKVSKNIKDLFVHKISEFVVMSTDNLILSVAVGVQMVGKVANYQLITTAVLSFVAKGVDALQASVGNLVVTESKERVYDVYDKLNFLCFWIGSVTSICLLGLTQPFIGLWIGDQYLLDGTILVVLVVNYTLCVMSRPLWQMMSVSGLFKEDKFNALAEMLVNLVISLVLVREYGAIGVFIGTTCSWILAWILKSKLLYKNFFDKSIWGYYRQIIIYGVMIVVEAIIVLYLLQQVETEHILITFLVKAAICVIVPNVINVLCFRTNNHYKYYKEKLIDKGGKLLDHPNTYDEWITKLICLLLLIVPLHGSTVSIELVGKLGSFILIGVSLIYFLWHVFSRNVENKKIRYALWAYIVGIIILIISGQITGAFEGFKVAVWICFVTSVGLACSLLDWRKLGKGILLLDLGVILWLGHMYMTWFDWRQLKALGEIPAWRNFQYIYNNPNFLGVVCVLLIMLLMMAYSLQKGERYVLYSVLFIPMLLESGGRTSLLALGAFIAMYILSYFSSKWRITHHIVGLGIILGAVAVVYVYIQIGSQENFAEINTWVKELTDKNLLSGRERLWVDSLNYIKEKPWTGYGLQVTLPELIGGDLNTHNQFVQILLQGGYIGIGVCIGIFVMIWDRLYQVKKSTLARMGSAVVVGIVIIASFESTLLGESITLGVIQWALIGMGISLSYNRSLNKEDTPQ